MKIVYIAVDGCEFNDQTSCAEYEAQLEERKRVLLTETHAFDHKGQQIKGDISRILVRAAFIRFDSQEAFNFFNRLCVQQGFKPVDASCKFRKDDVYLYDSGADKWSSTIEQIGMYQRFLDRF